MNPPVCPIHGKAMRPGNKGGYFCATKLPDGSWCKERGKDDSEPKSGGGGVKPNSDDARAIAAVQFAAALCHGQGPDSLADALACASKAYDFMQHLGGK